MGQSDVHEAAARICRALDEMNIPYALCGGLAVGRYGPIRMTEDVDVLLTDEGLRLFKQRWLGVGWVERFQGAKGMKDAHSNVNVDVLITGIGLLHTAFQMGRTLRDGAYDFAINAGICGSYNPGIPLGSVLHFTEEGIPEAGVEEDGEFRSFFEVGLMFPDEYPFDGGKLINTLIPEWETISRLQTVSGNSVNTMLTDPDKIKRLISAFPADVESMEGAAFLFGCLAEKVPSAQIRAVSNYVGERDKSKWEIRLAVDNLDEVIGKLLIEISDLGETG